PLAEALVRSTRVVLSADVAVDVDVDAVVQVNDQEGEKRLVLDAAPRLLDWVAEVEPDAVVAAGAADQILDVAARIGGRAEGRSAARDRLPLPTHQHDTSFS